MQAFLWWVTQTSLTTAVLVGAVLVASPLLKTRPALVHTLWFIVLLKFLVPPIVAWPWSVEEIISPIRSSEVLQTGPSQLGFDSRERFVSISVADAAADATSGTSTPGTPPTRSTWTRLVIATWLCGTTAVVLIQARRLIAFQRLVGGARPAPRRLSAEVEQVARQLTMRPLPTRIAARAATPFVWCLGRSRLIWPEALACDADVERCRPVIAHELAHVKRRDHWVAWLEMAAACVWWWNPLFWYVRRQLRETADLACDAHAVSTGADRYAYAKLFLELSCLASPRQTPAPVLGVTTGARRTVERRLSMILNERVGAGSPFIGLFFVAAVALVALPAWSFGDDASPQVIQPEGTSQRNDETGATPSGSESLQIRSSTGDRLEVQTKHGTLAGKEVEVSGKTIAISDDVVVERMNSERERAEQAARIADLEAGLDLLRRRSEVLRAVERGEIRIEPRRGSDAGADEAGGSSPSARGDETTASADEPKALRAPEGWLQEVQRLDADGRSEVKAGQRLAEVEPPAHVADEQVRQEIARHEALLRQLRSQMNQLEDRMNQLRTEYEVAQANLVRAKTIREFIRSEAGRKAAGGKAGDPGAGSTAPAKGAGQRQQGKQR